MAAAGMSSRGFRELDVRRLGVQTAHQRFGLPANAPAPSGVDARWSFTEYMAEGDEDETIQVGKWPRVAEWCMNVTAFSQVYNLYFAAYSNAVHIFRPGMQVNISRRLLILVPPVSPWYTDDDDSFLSSPNPRAARRIINNLIVGFLGNKEVLILAREDHCVLVYYVDQIKQSIDSGSKDDISPCIFEPTRASVWGLALHTQSRLIAVGTNDHTIELFAPAISTMQHGQPNLFAKSDGQEPHSRPGQSKYREYNSSTFIPRHSDGSICRSIDFKVVLLLERLLANNIPSLAFTSDRFGEAETVIAKDITGALWYRSIWTDAFKRIQSVEWNDCPGEDIEPNGWGVMVLDENFFKVTHDMAQTNGCEQLVATPREGINISLGLNSIITANVHHHRQLKVYAEGESQIQTDPKSVIKQHHWHAAEPCPMAPWPLPDIPSQISLRQPYVIDLIFDDWSNIYWSGNGYPTTDAPYLSALEWNEKYGAEVNHIVFMHGGEIPDLRIEEPGTGFPCIGPKIARNDSYSGPMRHDTQLVGSRSISDFVTDGSIVVHSNKHDLFLVPSATDTRVCKQPFGQKEFVRPQSVTGWTEWDWLRAEVREHIEDIEERRYDKERLRGRLWSLTTPETSVKDLIRQDRPHRGPYPRQRTPELYDRLNMLAAIPELSLVIAASQVGRVALCTVTRPLVEIDTSLQHSSQHSGHDFDASSLATVTGGSEPCIPPGGQPDEKNEFYTIKRFQGSIERDSSYASTFTPSELQYFSDQNLITIEDPTAAERHAKPKRSHIDPDDLDEICTTRLDNKMAKPKAHSSDIRVTNVARDQVYFDNLERQTRRSQKRRKLERQQESRAEANEGYQRPRSSNTPTFRVDKILPTKEEEDSSGLQGLELRPDCALLGMAISPIWRGEGKSNDRSRWRLLLHYANHTTIGYELWRGENGEVVCN